MASVARGPNTGVFVSFGAEDYFLDRDLESARRWPNRSVQVFGADDGLDERELVSVLEARESDDVPRTIIVDDAQKIKETKAKALREYLNEKSVTDLSTVLVAIVRGEKLPDLWAFAGSKGKLNERKKFKPWPDRRTGKTEYHTWIEDEAKKRGLGLEEGVSDLIFQACGDDLYKITNELRKLYILVGNGNKVTKQHVLLVIAPAAKTEPRDVIDAAFAKNVRGAMNSLSTLYKTQGDDAHVPLVYGLMKETQRVIQAKFMLEKGASEEDIAVALGMHPWRCKTAFLPYVRKHDVKALTRLMGRLCRLDQDVKGSSRSKRTLVELSVLSIAG